MDGRSLLAAEREPSDARESDQGASVAMTTADARLDPGGRAVADRPGIRAEVDALDVRAYTVPTDGHESDGTLEWDDTTLVVVRVSAGGVTGLGFSYADATAAFLIDRRLRPLVEGSDPWATSTTWTAMIATVRNVGRSGIAATAISAVDAALWDLKARLVGVSLVDLLGRARDAIPAYGSGGFTSYSDDRLAEQLGGWAAAGFGRVKMKVGREPARDPHRVDIARDAIGPAVELFVDANGAYDRSRALGAARVFAERAVTWFEEPVSSDDVAGLRFVRDRAPAGMAIAAGEYGWDQFHFRRLIEAGAVDVLQADVTRCLGVTGFLMAASLCEASGIPLSSHCAPALHAHVMCAVRPGMHLEWFHDHVRIEEMLFDGAPHAVDGAVAPDRTRPGFGLELRERDAAPFLAWRPG
jgi:L-alanine-DL-glutamate epimerase-like enolase superfamily enzyme